MLEIVSAQLLPFVFWFFFLQACKSCSAESPDCGDRGREKKDMESRFVVESFFFFSF